MGALDLAEVRRLREATLANGYQPVRVRGRGKNPVAQNWQKGEHPDALLQVTEDTSNTGILCSGLRVVDIDVDDQCVVAAIIGLVAMHLPNGAILRRRGGSPRLALVFRSADGAPAKRAVSGTKGKVEILGAGQQLVVFGIHPSGSELYWFRDRSPASISAGSLPAVSERGIDRFLEACLPVLGATITPLGNFPRRADPQNHAQQANVNELSAGIHLGHWFQELMPEHKRALIEACLRTLDNRLNDPRALWLTTIFAVADAVMQGCPDGRLLALKWSQEGAGWTSEQDFDVAWNSARPGGTTVGTLIGRAQEAGADLSPFRTIAAGTMSVCTSDAVASNSKDVSWRSKALKLSNLPAVPPKREFLHGTDLIRGAVTLLTAPGAKGKSTLCLTLGLAATSNRSLLGSHIFGGPLRVLYISAEDSAHEVHRRLWAAMQHHNLQERDVETLRIMGADSMPYALLESERGCPRLRVDVWKGLLAEIEHFRPDILIMDPLISFFGAASLNDNSAAGLLFGELSRIAVTNHLAILVAHHVSKGRDNSSPESAMGAVSFTNLSRAVLAIEPLPPSEAMTIGVMPSEAGSYFRVSGTKQNMSPSSRSDRWFRLVPVELQNAKPPVYPKGDMVAVVEYFVPSANVTGPTKAMLQAALAVIASASPPLSPTSRGANSPFPVIQAAIAPHLGGQASEADAKAVLKQLLDTGQVAIGAHATARKGHGAYPRQGLMVPGHAASSASHQSP
jgi:hypothetical protein